MTENTPIFESYQCSPPIPWNPQRSDPPTPFADVHGWSQCMGNSFQNLWVWVGKKFGDPAWMFGSDGETTEPNGIAYYAGLEAYEKQRGWSPSDADFAHEFHRDYLNIALNAKKIPLVCVAYNADLEKLGIYHKLYQRPAVLGTWGIVPGIKGHIVTPTGVNYRNGQIEAFRVEDPAGDARTGNYMANPNGHGNLYPYKLLNGRVTKMLFLEDVK